jgi:hypothetical protein
MLITRYDQVFLNFVVAITTAIAQLCTNKSQESQVSEYEALTAICACRQTFKIKNT